MSGEGNWVLHATWRRCTGLRQCHKCQADPDAKPHGPYYELRRRNPATGEQDLIYLGRIQPEPDKELVAKRVGVLFATDYMPPKQSQARRIMKEEILQLIADLTTV